jgi:tetratricopeptide (TPR) repeat protein
MKSVQSLKRGLEKARRLCDDGRHDRAFTLIDRLRQKWPDNPELLVMWANLLQLQAENVGPPLQEAKRALQRAVGLSEESPRPLIELAHYLFALDDDTQAASRCFTKAVALSRRLLQEALQGEARALVELGRRSDALGCLAEAYWLGARNGKQADGEETSKILEQLKELALVE